MMAIARLSPAASPACSLAQQSARIPDAVRSPLSAPHCSKLSITTAAPGKSCRFTWAPWPTAARTDPVAICSSDDFTSRQQILRNPNPDLVGRFQVEHELAARHELDWNFGGFGAFENLVDYCGKEAPRLGHARSIGDYAASV